jgi:cytochrome P450
MRLTCLFVLGFDFEAVTRMDSEWLEGYDKIRLSVTKPFFLLFQIFDDQLKWMFSSRVEAHRNLDALLEKIDGMVADKRVSITEKINTLEYKALPDSEKDLLTLMIEAELQGEGKLSDLEIRVCNTIRLLCNYKLKCFALSAVEEYRRLLFRWT